MPKRIQRKRTRGWAKRKPTPKKPWVTFEKDVKTGQIALKRRGDTDCHWLQFPRNGDSPKEARIVFAENDGSNSDDGLWLDHSDVKWLAQALPELLSEMERADVED